MEKSVKQKPRSQNEPDTVEIWWLLLPSAEHQLRLGILHITINLYNNHFPQFIGALTKVKKPV